MCRVFCYLRSLSQARARSLARLSASMLQRSRRLVQALAPEFSRCTHTHRTGMSATTVLCVRKGDQARVAPALPLPLPAHPPPASRW